MRPSAYATGVFVVNMVLVQLAFVAWALFAASIERSFARASLLGNALSIFFILSVGFFVVNVPGWIRWFRWLSPYFYSFRIMSLSQFHGRDFVDGGSTTSGDAVLRGLRIAPGAPLYPMFLGHLGFIAVVLALALLLLSTWTPGGVRHARRVPADAKGKELAAADLDLARARVELRAHALQLAYVRRHLPSLRRSATPVLTRVSAVFPPGAVTVVMGPSGSGKSTLLRLLAGRPLAGGALGAFVPAGAVTLNGAPLSARNRHACALVEQEDEHHLPALTVRETLRYAAATQLPAGVGRRRKRARAEEVLRMLGLRDCADGVVGGALLKGISGGEKRRLSLACQMINDPAVLIVDEPTSGLDANTARNVMEALREIARSGRTVIVSLHQPRSDIYTMGDNYLLLAKRGNVVYSGPREQLLPHFALAGYVCPPLFNPSDFFMDLVSVDPKGDENQDASSAWIAGLVQHWETHEQKIAEFAADQRAAVSGKEEPAMAIEERQETTPLRIAVPVILERSFKNTWRQPDLFWTRFSQAPILAVCFFLFFLRLSNGPTAAQDRIGLVAEVCGSLTFVGFLNLAAMYPQEKTVFMSDYRSAGGRYSSGAFLLSFSLFALIPEALSAMLFAVIMDIATGMRHSPRVFFEFFLGCWAQLSFGESIGIAFASWFDTMGLSVSLVSIFLTFASQCSSVFSASVATFLADIAWIFPVKYAARILLINEMRGKTFDCSQADIASGVCTAATGQQVLDLFGFHDSTGKLVGILIATTVAYRVAAWAILALRMRSI